MWKVVITYNYNEHSHTHWVDMLEKAVEYAAYTYLVAEGVVYHPEDITSINIEYVE